MANRKKSSVRTKAVPFGVDKNLKTSLVDQVADGFRQAIMGGYYRPGDVLPSIRALAPVFGVSVRVTAQVVKILANEGLVAPRTRLGSVVLARKTPYWKGNVILIRPDGEYGFFQTEFTGCIRKRLSQAGYLVMQATVPKVSPFRYDATILDIMLNRPVDIAVVLADCKDIISKLEKYKVPYVVTCGEMYGENCVGIIPFDFAPAVADFVSHCISAEVASVVQVGKGAGDLDVLPTLKAAGIKATAENIDLRWDRGHLEDIQKATVEFFRKNGRDRRWPDLMYFTDDYLASAALLCLEHLRIDVPEDLKVVVLSNRGHCPVSWDTLSRIEVDPVEFAEEVSAAVLSHLNGTGFPEGDLLTPRYIVGSSFPLP